MLNSKNRNKSNIQSATKIFGVLEELANHGGRMRLKDLAEALGMPMSTAHRVVSSLEGLGYVNQDPNTGEYMLGVRLLFLASAVLHRLDLRKVAYPLLEKLRDETGETANLVVLDSDEALYIEKVESKALVRAFSLIGKRAPVHATGVGKVLLADLAWPDVVVILKRKGMPRLTPNTITDLGEFMEELNRVRAQGYALDMEECEDGAMCIAAPVRDDTGKAIAAISISGPKSRFTDAKLPELTASVKKYAEKLSRILGYNDQFLIHRGFSTAKRGHRKGEGK